MGHLAYLQLTEEVLRPEQFRTGLRSSGALEQIGEFGLKSHRRARCASCRQLRDNSMASVSQLNPYQCDQCGTANIVAAPVLYQQGTHTYSTRFHSGTTQSFSAQAAAPPDPRGYVRPLLFLGNTNKLYFLLGLRRTWQDSWTSQGRGDARGNGRHFLTSGLDVSCWDVPEFSKDCPLQP